MSFLSGKWCGGRTSRGGVFLEVVFLFFVPRPWTIPPLSPFPSVQVGRCFLGSVWLRKRKLETRFLFPSLPDDD